ADEMVLNYKKTKNIQPYHLNPYEVENINIDVISSKMATILGFALGGGLLFILLITMYNPAINTTLGERDQSTYKILLMNPVSPFEIFIGKYLNVAILGLLALMPYAIEIIIFYAWGFSNTILSSFSNFSFFNFTSLFIITISAAIFISALCFIICSFSKSKIQAQSLMTLLLFIVTIPVIITGTMDLHLTRYTSLLPLVNVPMMFEHLISGERDLISILAGIIVNLGFSVIMIWFSLGAFTVQWKGSSDSKSLSELLNFKRRKTKNLLPAHAFFAFCIACMGYIYGGILFTAFEIKIFAYLFSPLLFSLGTSIFIIQYSSLDFTKVINWQLPKLSYLFKLIAISCVLSFMVNYLMQSTDIVKIFEIKFPNLFENATTVSLIGNLFLFALIPAITEEILFRGIIFKGLRYQYSFLVSSSVSAILFGIIHFSLFKWGHTFILGLILAYIYEKKGMYSAIVFHLFFNAFALMAAHFNLINIISSSTPNVFGISFIILVMIAILGFKARKNFHVRSR
ncbi:MAG: type II CAAX prenyl endopeptidase Rce1 family protein, partial [bacterium]